jgi:hypothetical protein
MSDLKDFAAWLYQTQGDNLDYSLKLNGLVELIYEYEDYKATKDSTLIDGAEQVAVLQDLKPTDLIIFQSKTRFSAEEAMSAQKFLEGVCQCRVLLLSPDLNVAKTEIDFSDGGSS